MQKIFSNIIDIGEQMLICGAEVHRVEDSIERMCKAFGAKAVDVCSINSSLVVTITMEDEAHYTETRRISVSGTDMERLHRLNELSRTICRDKLSKEQIKDAYDTCMKSKTYPTWLVCLSYGMIAGAFTAFFGGKIQDILLSPVIGIVISFITYMAEKVVINKIFLKFLCSFVVTAMAFLFLKIGFISNVDMVIIGNIMVLIPGIGLTNAIRDLFVGDSIAGLLRTVEAILFALAISAGYFLFVWTMGGVLS